MVALLNICIFLFIFMNFLTFFFYTLIFKKKTFWLEIFGGEHAQTLEAQNYLSQIENKQTHHFIN